MCVRAEELPPPTHQRHKIETIFNLRVICLIVLVSVAPMARAQKKSPGPRGIAWKVTGAWHVEGDNKPRSTGDAVTSGSLLEPSIADSAHSITVLLPDGQAILYECFTAADCARGFRVPALYRPAEPFAVQMLAHIRAALVDQRNHGSASPNQVRVAKDELVTVLNSNRQITISERVAKLPSGHYFGDLRSVNAKYPERLGIPLEKSGPAITLEVPGPGLYMLTISDSTKRPRVEFLLAVVLRQDSPVVKDFQQAHALMASWIGNYFGWPLHPFQRAYLKSLMLHIPSTPEPLSARIAASPDPNTTAEPTFSPRPGLVAGNLKVTLRCATPRATIHFTVDTSQPRDASPIYRAPVVMTQLPLTIKAFASSPGKKDSPVVTGMFRPENPDK